jgi:glycine hydroxymethyltransferase
MAALATAFRLAQREEFTRLMQRIVENGRVLAEEFEKRGLRVVYGGTDTHIVLLDVSSVGTHPEKKDLFTPGTSLKGEIAARILDLAGIVVNKNTIPGDTKTVLASGIRFGTTWVTQRGLGPDDMKAIAEIVHRVVTGIIPFAYEGISGEQPKGKIPFELIRQAKRDVAEIAERAAFDLDVEETDYPHFWGLASTSQKPPWFIKLYGWRSRAFLQEICATNISALKPGHSMRTAVLHPDATLLGDVLIAQDERDEFNRDTFYMRVDHPDDTILHWIRALGEGYIVFDYDDIYRKVQGPVMAEVMEEDRLSAEIRGLLDRDGQEVISSGTPASEAFREHPDLFDMSLPYFVGQNALARQLSKDALPAAKTEKWEYQPPEQKAYKRTPLFETHKKLGAKMVPFAGWEMPVWYSSVTEEHKAVRETAGLFDVGHMGCIEVRGEYAIEFLNCVNTNYAHWLQICESCYGFMLDADGNVIDDLLTYCRCDGSYLLVVNAANEEKDWEWLNAVNEGSVIIDNKRPWVETPGKVELINLKHESAGKEQIRDVALQGPASRTILKACAPDKATRDTIDRLKRNNLAQIKLGGIDVLVTRTGYTGEPLGYELFVHPDSMVAFWNMLLEKGEAYGIKPCGLACRDSTRIEAGLPLYGHELAGEFDLSPGEAGFGGYVKYHKPFFIGRDEQIVRDFERDRQLVRWMIDKKGVRRPNPGDPVINKNGVVIGSVTSCSINDEGTYVGLAFVQPKYTEPETELGIFVLPRKKVEEKSKDQLEAGDRVLLHVPARVVSRFMIKES